MKPGKRTVRARLFFCSQFILFSLLFQVTPGFCGEHNDAVLPQPISPSIMIIVDSYEKLVAQLRHPTLPSELLTREFIVQEDLAERVSRQELAHEEAVEIVRDLRRLDGMIYTVPELDVLKFDLGFAKDAPVDPQDFPELVRVHLQVSFEMQARTAAYVGELLQLPNAESGPEADREEGLDIEQNLGEGGSLAVSPSAEFAD